MKDLRTLPIDFMHLWPPYLQTYKEMQAINAMLCKVSQEFVAELQKRHQNHFVMTADLDGIIRFEKEYNIQPRDDATLEDRRFEILTKQRNRPPYTKRSLKMMLDTLLGVDSYTLDIRPKEYMVYVTVELTRKNQISAVAALVRRVIPANMDYRVDIRYNQYYMLSKFTYAELKKYTYKELRESPEIREIYLERGGELH